MSSKTKRCELLSKICQEHLLSSTVQQCRLFIGERAIQLSWQMFGWNERKSTASDFPPPLVAPLPTLQPVSGEYGRLDSPWRVRSHLETSGQPKAGTVTITQPKSLWALPHWERDGKKWRRRDYTGEAVGLRRRGICVIINDQWWAKKGKSSLSLPLSRSSSGLNRPQLFSGKSLANTLN